MRARACDVVREMLHDQFSRDIVSDISHVSRLMCHISHRLSHVRASHEM